jgi:predicted RNase H-related nuclease YkuK (DUF458 family)
MKTLKNLEHKEFSWFVPDGDEISFDMILVALKEHTKKSGKIFIGTDSILNKDQCIFARAICLHGAIGQSGGTYFISRKKESAKPFKALVTRMLAEVQKTVDIALRVSENCPDASIELHLDISGSLEKGATGKYADILTGFARSAGFPFKIKPDSWASSSIADRHSK